MLRGPSDNGSRVAMFDGSILAAAAVSAPSVMLKSVGNVFRGFDDLGDEERELLFETFRVWQASDASLNVTAEALVCHPIPCATGFSGSRNARAYHCPDPGM
jgi:hypothetical protein